MSEQKRVDNCPGCENQDGFTFHNHPTEAKIVAECWTCETLDSKGTWTGTGFARRLWADKPHRAAGHDVRLVEVKP